MAASSRCRAELARTSRAAFEPASARRRALRHASRSSGAISALMAGIDAGGTDNSCTPRPTRIGTAAGPSASPPHTATPRAVAPRGLARRRDQPQHRRMQRVEPRRELRVPAVHRERVLREVVGADREEVDVPRERVGEHGRGRRLDHDAESTAAPRTPGAHAIATSRARTASSSATSVTIGSRIRHCAGGRTRRIARSCARSRSGLRQARAHAAQAERRVVLVRQRQVIERLVAADVERADRQRPAVEGGRDRLVDARAARPRSARRARSRNRNSVRSRPQPSAPSATACSASADEPRLANTSMRSPSARARRALRGGPLLLALQPLVGDTCARLRRASPRRASRAAVRCVRRAAPSGPRVSIPATDPPRPASAGRSRSRGSRRATSVRRRPCTVRRRVRSSAVNCDGSRSCASTIARSGHVADASRFAARPSAVSTWASRS